MDTIREEIAGVRNEDDQAAFDLGILPEKCVLENKSCAHAHDHSDDEAASEDEEEDSNGFEDIDNIQITRDSSRPVPLCCLEEDDGDGIVQYGFSENDSIELGLDFVDVENGQYSDGIGC